MLPSLRRYRSLCHSCFGACFDFLSTRETQSSHAKTLGTHEPCTRLQPCTFVVSRPHTHRRLVPSDRNRLSSYSRTLYLNMGADQQKNKSYLIRSRKKVACKSGNCYLAKKPCSKLGRAKNLIRCRSRPSNARPTPKLRHLSILHPPHKRSSTHMHLCAL